MEALGNIILSLFIGIVGNIIYDWVSRREAQVVGILTWNVILSLGAIGFSVAGIFFEYVWLTALVLSSGMFVIGIRSVYRRPIKSNLLALVISTVAFCVVFSHTTLEFYKAILARRDTDSVHVFNGLASDYPLLRVNNMNTTPETLRSGMPGYWNPWVYAKTADKVALAVYYHNTSERKAKDVRVKVEWFQNGSMIYCSASLKEGLSNNVRLGSCAILIQDYEPDASYSLRYEETEWYPDRHVDKAPLLHGFQPQEEAVGYFSGLPIGDIESGNEHQGNVLVYYTIGKSK